jgi:hypothetical protein
MFRYGDSTSSTFSCDETICNNIYYQSNCGDLKHWASSQSEYWAVQFRREIYWKSDCDASMIDIKSTEKPIKEISTALGWNMAFNLIGNIIGGIFLNIYVWRVSLRLVEEHNLAKISGI